MDDLTDSVPKIITFRYLIGILMKQVIVLEIYEYENYCCFSDSHQL